MKPPPPGRFSTSTRWFHDLPSLSATRRSTASGPLPGANAVTSVTGFCGNGACAKAGRAAASSAATRVLRCIGMSPWKVGESGQPLFAPEAELLLRDAVGIAEQNEFVIGLDGVGLPARHH